MISRIGPFILSAESSHLSAVADCETHESETCPAKCGSKRVGPSHADPVLRSKEIVSRVDQGGRWGAPTMRGRTKADAAAEKLYRTALFTLMTSALRFCSTSMQYVFYRRAEISSVPQRPGRKTEKLTEAVSTNISPTPSMKSRMMVKAMPTFPPTRSSTQPSARTEQGRTTPPPMRVARSRSSGT